MNIKQTLKIVLTTSMLSCTLAYPLYAAANVEHQMQHGQGMEHHGHEMKRMAKFLNLSDAQREQAKTIHQNTRTQAETLRPMMQSYHQELQALLQADSYDEQAVIALRAKYHDTFEQMALLHSKARYDFFQILTAEQQAKLKDVIAKRHPMLEGEPE